MSVSREQTEPQLLIDAAQAFTASFVNLGPEIATNQYNTVGVWLKLVVNDSLNMRIRAICKLRGDDLTDYQLPIYTTNPDIVSVQPQVIEFENDLDQNIGIAFNIDNVVDKVQLQISAGTVGITPGEVSSALYVLGMR